MPTERGSTGGSGRARTLDIERALAASPEEGARRVALHWLAALADARTRWRDEVEQSSWRDASSPDRAREILHKARVALRRLRAVLREHRDHVRVGGRLEGQLRALNTRTNSVRDADVQRSWLEAERDALPEEARAEAERLRDSLTRDGEQGRRTVTTAFRKGFDRFHDPLVERLLSWSETRHLDEPPREGGFAAHVADRIRRGSEQIVAELDPIDALLSEETQERLHALRIRLKRQRAMLAPFTDVHPDIAAWYTLATRGQDLLGAMRDAVILGELAAAHDLAPLARALCDTAEGHGEQFLREWGADAAAVARVAAVAEAAAVAFEASALRATDEPPREIERKYLLRGMPPEALRHPPARIEQGWLPGETLRERLRRATDADGTVHLTRTVKFGALGSRVELEERTSPELFDAMWPHTEGVRIRKDRYSIPDGRFVWEVDLFLDRELVVAEVELEAGDDVPPAPEWLSGWIVRDVTEEPAYTNSSLARSRGA